jgi:hypothetical protein
MKGGWYADPAAARAAQAAEKAAKAARISAGADVRMDRIQDNIAKQRTMLQGIPMSPQDQEQLRQIELEDSGP